MFTSDFFLYWYNTRALRKIGKTVGGKRQVNYVTDKKNNLLKDVAALKKNLLFSRHHSTFFSTLFDTEA